MLIGRRAVEAYVEGAPGRLMRSLKSVLGTALIDETTQVGRERTRLSRRHRPLPRRGEAARRSGDAAASCATSSMAGRCTSSTTRRMPTARPSRPCARSRARSASTDVTFQFEPIAAALDYERQITAEEVALIADIGGGTSDFSIVRLGPERHGKADRAADILANDGVRIGGTDFDRQLSLGVVMPLFGFGSAMKRRRPRRAIALFPRPRHLVEHQPHV